MRPRVFIGCATEALEIATTVQALLSGRFDTTVWFDKQFAPSQFAVESLLTALRTHDFGIFIFTADDVVRMRGAEAPAVRDNVIFELGLFIGGLGRERSYILAPAGVTGFHWPTDVAGLNPAVYSQDPQHGGLRAALQPACDRLADRMTRVGVRRSAWGRAVAWFRRQ